MRAFDIVLGGAVLGAMILGSLAVVQWQKARRKADQSQALEGRYRALVEQIPAVTYTWDPTQPTGTAAPLYVSPQIKDVLGFTAEQWREDPGLRLRSIHPEDREQAIEATERSDFTGNPVDIEYRLIAKDGRVIWIRDQAVAVRKDEYGRPSLMQGVMYDVTNQKAAYESAKGTLSLLEATLDSTADGILVVDRASKIITFNRRFAEMWRFPPEMLEMRDDKQVQASMLEQLKDPDAFLAKANELYASPDAESYDVLEFKDGRVFERYSEPQRLEGIPVGRVWGFLDVTARAKAEQQIRDAEERYRTLVEQTPAVTYTKAVSPGDPPVLTNMYISPQVEQVLGITPEEWLGDPDIWLTPVHPEDRDRFVAEGQRTRDTGSPFNMEYRIVRRDGSAAWIRESSVQVTDDEGNPSYWHGFMFDITEAKRAEEQLREAETKYRMLVEQLPATVYLDAVDPARTTLYLSPQYEGLVGFSREERLLDPELWTRQLHPADRDRVLKAHERANQTGEPWAQEYRVIAKDGRVVWLRDEALMVRDADGQPLYWQGVLIDITERKLAEEALRRREAILEAVSFAAERFLKGGSWQQSIPDVLRHLGEAADVSRAHVYENHRAADGDLLMSGRFEWTAVGVHSTITDPGNINSPYHEGFERWQEVMSAGGIIYGLTREFTERERMELEREDILSTIAVPVFVEDDWWGYLGFDDCVSERDWSQAEIDALKAAADTLGAAMEHERAQARIREAEEKYRTLIERVPAVVYYAVFGEAAPWVYVSPQVEAILGYSPEEWVGNPALWLERIHPEDRDRVMAEENHSRDTGEPLSSEYRMLARDGRVVWLRDEAEVVRDNEGAGLLRGLMYDITPEKEAEEQLRQAEARYRALVEHIPAVLYIDRLEEGGTTPLYVSPQVVSVLGFSQEDWLSDPQLWRKYLHPEDAERAVGEYGEGLGSGEPFRLEYRLFLPDNRLVWIEEDGVLIEDAEGHTLVQGVLTDVTERKLAEQSLQENERREREAAERLRALDDMKNTFLAAVSHELRSPLTSILGLALTLEQQDLPTEDRSDLLGRLATNARKLDRLLKDLLDIDRLNRGIVTPQYRLTDVGALVRRTVESLELKVERSVMVEAEPVVVPVDPAKAERIVENLLANAMRHTTTDTQVWVRVRPYEGGVMIAVEDDGPGVPQELQQTIFEPFQQGPTASPHAPGTGIGLSLVALFAELHGGRAWVEDREGGGASFRVYLPGIPPSSNGDRQETSSAMIALKETVEPARSRPGGAG